MARCFVCAFRRSRLDTSPVSDLYCNAHFMCSCEKQWTSSPSRSFQKLCQAIVVSVSTHKHRAHLQLLLLDVVGSNRNPQAKQISNPRNPKLEAPKPYSPPRAKHWTLTSCALLAQQYITPIQTAQAEASKQSPCQRQSWDFSAGSSSTWKILCMNSRGCRSRRDKHVGRKHPRRYPNTAHERVRGQRSLGSGPSSWANWASKDLGKRTVAL